MSINPSNTSVLISLESIQQQIEHCENIVNNIDKLVPNLYKIRQQALAQKNYISDIHHALMSNNNQQNRTDSPTTYSKVRSGTEGAEEGQHPEGTNIESDGVLASDATEKIPGNPSTNPIVLTVSVPSVNATIQTPNQIPYKNKDGQPITKNSIDSLETARRVFQSLYKFKHDQGTAIHFTTQQIDASATGITRTKGLNLADVESITDGLNDYLSISDNAYSSSGTDGLTKIKNTLLKLFAPASTDAAEVLKGGTGGDESIDNIEGDVTNLSIFKAPEKGSTGDVNNPLTSERSVKAKRTVFSGGTVPNAADLQKIVTFGLS